jgi:hypothetical protein
MKNTNARRACEVPAGDIAPEKHHIATIRHHESAIDLDLSLHALSRLPIIE